MMTSMGRYYTVACERMLRGLDERHAVETLLSAEEVLQQLVGWNGATISYERARVHEQIAAQARRTPEAVAVVCGEMSLSYEKLNEKGGGLAQYLAEAGVELETRVGICLRRSVEMMIGVLGVMKAGGVYVPLEPGLPKERIEYMVKDAGIEWVLVESETMGSIPLAGVDVVVMDGAGSDAQWLAEAQESGETNKRRVRDAQAAYILYTSGSTGRPKGVIVEHRGLSNYVGHASAKYVGEEIRGSVGSTPLSFDATVTPLLPPLVNVGRVELLTDHNTTRPRLPDLL